MTEDGGARVSSDESSQTRQRKKRKWDQPAEPFVSGGIAVPGTLPLSSLGSLPGIMVPCLGPIPSTLVLSSLAPNYVPMYPVLSAVPLQQQSVAVNAKLNQVKIQEDLVIAREIVINDAEPSLRYRLTKRQTQEEIQKCTGAVVITRGKYRPPDALSDGEKPLYLHISAGAHLKDTAERIIAVDRAAAMIEEMLKQGANFQFPISNGGKVNQGLSVCIYLGFDVDPSLDIAARIRGPNDQYISHIMHETGATVSLRGRGSGASESSEEEGEQPLHLLLSSNKAKSLQDAKLLAENLLDTISIECGASRTSSSSKVYGAVPPPQQLLPVTSNFGHGHEESTNIAAALTSHISPAAVPAVFSTPAVPVANNLVPHMPMTQPGIPLSNGISGTNMGNYSGSSLTSGTRYRGYEGIYPQATILQQVAMALKQSPSVTSSSAPATTLPSTAAKSSATSGSGKEREKRPPQRRKFQELPVSQNVTARANQGLDSIKFGEREAGPDARDPAMMPPPKPAVPSLHGASPHAQRSMGPPLPPPKFTSSRPNPDNLQEKRGLKETRSDHVPDTLVKLMEYGDEDDDPDENQTESLNSSNTARKPFWAV